MQAVLRQALRRSQRTFATATVSSSSTLTHSSTVASRQNIIPLSNVEAQWDKLTQEDKLVVHEQLEEVMKKDWKELSLDEKKAGQC